MLKIRRKKLEIRVLEYSDILSRASGSDYWEIVEILSIENREAVNVLLGLLNLLKSSGYVEKS